ncbi:DUF6524 family protein [Teredinibacter waterburyi]|jgi:hypothetical protein|uniref:DUF6524 family protein n=1 Tax=Teredinibacter waterburyi TaxID=1500538 RepID=UPI00165F014C|nr:DUF6524 family protein [Teredinibacter waterburyi]
MAHVTHLTLAGFALRLVFAAALVFATYNPTGYSYAHWLKMGNITPYLALAGMVLIIGWAIYVRATFRALGKIGLFLAATLFACLIWLFVDLGWLNLKNPTLMSWVVEVKLAFILAIGISWSHIRRRLSGQVDTDELG